MMITAPTEQEQNIAYVRRLFDAFSAGDFQIYGDTRDDFSSAYDQLIEYFRFVRQRTKGAYQIVPRTFAASGNNVFVEYHVNSTHAGRSFESDGVMRLTIVDGKTLEVTNYLEVCRRRGV
jgi:ketosteroid isomerase-like protein